MAGAASNLKRAVTQRGKNSLQIEREKFESGQITSIVKAINENEVPTKEKHIRVALLGTYKDQSSSLFWRVATTQVHLQGNQIVCWKFCHVLHKLLREGHPKCLQEAKRYRPLLDELCQLWKHLREGYGRLIAFYTKLLQQKLSFHEKNPEFPGNLFLQEDQFEQIVGNDVNTYFELSVDMLDYMDDILALQSAVFGSLDMSRSNSMTNSGQCRLSPLILCIQDSCQLYDYCVKILFKLHSSLPPDTLGGHRDRFSKQYTALKEFYHHSANLQYFKNLIKVPKLPDRPPNFLQASNLHLHVKPVAIVPEPEPEVADVHEEMLVETLVDTSSTASSQEEVVSESPQQQQRNGAPSPAMPDDRDLMISRLLQEVNELKRELARVKMEDQVIIESLRNRLKELEMELSELRQIAESTQEENETLKTALKEGERNTVTIDRLTTMEKVAKVNDEKFKKMKDIYQKLRAEHVQLLRSNADVKKEMSELESEKVETETKLQSVEQSLCDLQREKQVVEQNLEQNAEMSSQQQGEAQELRERLEGDKQSLEQELRDLESAKSSLESSLLQCQSDLDALRQNLDETQQQHRSTEESMSRDLDSTRLKMLVSAVEEGESMIKDALEQAENPHHHSVTGTAEYLLHRAEPVLKSLTSLRDSCAGFQQDKEVLGEVIKDICDFSHRLSETIVQGFATSHSTASIEKGQELSDECRESGEEGLKLLGLLKQDDLGSVPDQSDRVRALIERIMQHAEELLPKIEDVQAEQMGDLVDKEMHQTSEAIEKAAAKIAEMLAKSREDHTGVQLEVNENILDSCNGLMKAIKLLIQKSKSLQNEIISQGRGSSSKRDFYKKHHRWTEGLLSAAKAVGWGANVLVEAADKVVRGEGKFEELVVCSQEIAASTTQLVVSSKVKADKNSKNLRELADASRGVSTATGQVVASSKAGAQMIEDLSDMDFSQLTLHQAKRQEMESQVRVLELESDLEKERKRLMELRKTHYQLAGESEGWEQEDIDNQTAK